MFLGSASNGKKIISYLNHKEPESCYLICGCCRCRARPCREVLQERSSELGGRFLEKYLNLCGDSETVEEITVDVRGPGRGKRGKKGRPNPSMPMYYYTQKGKGSGGSGGGSGGCPGSLEDCIAACPPEVRVFKVCSANCGKRCKKK